MADFVARLGSRASVPGEVRSRFGVEEYAGLLVGDDRPLPDLRHGRLSPSALDALLRALAVRPSAELNRARLAAVTGIPPTTIAPYVAALVTLGHVRLVPGARAAVAKRAIARPRVVFEDPALARRLAGDDPAGLTEMDGRARLAPYLEGIAAAELLRQQATSEVDYRVTHLRERNGLEVDLLVELPDETVYGLEVRTAAGFRPHQFRNLEALAARAGSSFRGGIVLNTAPVGFKYRPGMWGLPISALWEWDDRRPGVD